MSQPLELSITVDNSAYESIDAAAGLRDRTINVGFDPLPSSPKHPDGSFQVRAYGTAIPPAGDGQRMGETGYSRHEAYGWIGRLRSIWQRRVIDYRVNKSFPFSAWDLSGPTERGHLDAVGLELARAGRQLFTLLFRKGDEELREIADLLEAALRSDDQLIEIHSDHLFAPWWMLYTPPDPQTDLFDEKAPWEFAGFWGFRHLIQHTVRRHLGWSPKITAPRGQLAVGLNVDPRIDAARPPAVVVPYVGPLTEFFATRTRSVVRCRKLELARAMQAADFPDKLIYFACHGHVSGEGTTAAQASLTLSDDDPITATDFTEWLTNQPLSTNPVVFIGACEGGQMSSMFYKTFGLELLEAGANCVIGPQVDLPVPFAARYADALFTRFLAGARLGDAVRDLTRECALERQTPLGLIISLYRGLDTRLVTAEA